MFSTGAPPEESLINNTKLFTAVFDSSISELQDQVNKLNEITEGIERTHRSATVGSLKGGIIGATGGVTSIVGLALALFTMGASLMVTAVGVGAAVVGGVTGAVSNITDMIKQKTFRKEIETVLKAIQDKLNPLLKFLEEIELRLEEIKRSQPTGSSTQTAQIGAGLGRGAGFAVEAIQLINFLELGKAAAQVSRTVKAAGALTGVLSGIFVILDIVFIVKDAKELREIDKEQKDGSERSDTVKFIQTMKETVICLNETLKELWEIRQVLCRG
uniref:Uncharacterized protein n=1 Tax=Astyanax mexicanus TaxID=7994 RepID=A0A3B1K5Q3_ASTMX